MKFSHTMALLLITSVPAIGETTDWRYSLGVHDLYVPDVDSNTFGLNARISADQQADRLPHLFGSFDLFVDNDKDHLDPDHVPIWWQLHAGSDGNFWQGDALRVGWTADLNTRMNTASSVERQMTALPALVAGYDGAIFQDSLELGAGWFFLEIDDDAAREQGYDREGLRNSTAAYALTNKASLRLGDRWTLSGLARRWWDGDETLESQYSAELRGDLGHWLDGAAINETALLLDADYYEYNLDLYNHPDGPPVLRWDHDLLFRVSLESKW